MDDFQIDGIRKDVTESLKSAVRYSIFLDPRCFRWKILRLPGPKAPLTRSWWATWLAVTRHGGFDEVGSLESLLIVFQAFRLL